MYDITFYRLFGNEFRSMVLRLSILSKVTINQQSHMMISDFQLT